MKVDSTLGLILMGAVSPGAVTASTEDEEVARLWKSKCGACHGTDGKGQTKQGARWAEAT